MATQKALLTADDLLRMPEDDYRYELLDGVLVKMSPPGNSHGRAQTMIGHLILTYALPRNLGQVFGEVGVILRRNPDRVRAPDVCFIARERIPEGGFGAGLFEIVPDLIVEIVSPSDRRGGIDEKVQEWLRSGARLVWLVRTEPRSVAVYDQRGEARVLDEAGMLTAEPVLPGFSVPVRELFA
jgi:Uma2 family endonuclease